MSVHSEVYDPLASEERLAALMGEGRAVAARDLERATCQEEEEEEKEEHPDVDMAPLILSRKYAEADNVYSPPPEYKPIYAAFKEQQSKLWTTEEIDIAEDIREFPKLRPNLRDSTHKIFAYFRNADKMVAENCGVNFEEEVTPPWAKMCYAVQSYTERIHDETYNMLDSHLTGAEKRKEYMDVVRDFESVRLKIAWTRSYMDRTRNNFVVRLVAFVITELVFFSSSFCFFFFLRKKSLLPGVTFANELISVDEGLHGKFGVLLYRDYVVAKLSEEDVRKMVWDAYVVEARFVREVLDLGGEAEINAKNMVQYVQFVCDTVLVMLGCSKMFEASNPFDFMDLISLQGKTNFFEKRVGEYAKAVTQSVEDRTVKFDEEF